MKTLILFATILSVALAQTCFNETCCESIQNPNPSTGSGFLQFNSDCLAGNGTNCVGTTGCQLCFNPQSGAANVGNRPNCTRFLPPPPPPPPLTEAELNDIRALNYALFLENLESAFYNKFLVELNSTDFVNAGFDMNVFLGFLLIKEHEQAHVNFLRQVITSLGGTPVSPCNYTFESTQLDVPTFVQMAGVLENTGVRAYDGALDTLSDATLLTSTATIATVEARHAAWINTIEGINPFPNAFDNATQPADIEELVLPLINSCPEELVLPVISPRFNATCAQ